MKGIIDNTIKLFLNVQLTRSSEYRSLSGTEGCLLCLLQQCYNITLINKIDTT